MRQSLLRLRSTGLQTGLKVVAALAALVLPAQAYTVVEISTGAPAGLEKSFIANTTTYYSASVVPNPYVPNTYHMVLFAPVANPAVLVDSGTYAFVWSEGESYGRSDSIRTILGSGNAFCDASPYCSSGTVTVPGQFTTTGSSYSVTMDTATCAALVCEISADLYNVLTGTPSIVPGQ